MKNLLKFILPPSMKDVASTVSLPSFPRSLRRVVHLDDDTVIREKIAQAAELFFVELHTADTIREVKAMIKASEAAPFDTLILDVVLSNGIGVEFYRYVSERWPRTTVIFITEHDNFENRDAIERIGPAQIIKKARALEPRFVEKLFDNLGMQRKESAPPH